MFTLDSPHFISLLCALSFSLLVHLALGGFTNTFRNFLVSIILFPVILMGLTLIVPQDFLQYSSYLYIVIGLGLAFYKMPLRFKNIPQFESKEKWILFGVFIYLFSSFYMSTTIFRNGGGIQDALVYHLEGPKEWALYLNGAKFNANNPIAFTTSYYDYYYYFLFLLAKPFFIYAAPLASTQYEFFSYTMLLTAQTFSGIIAFVYIPLLILRFSSSLGLYKYLVIFFIYGLRLFTWSWILPKNDPYPFLCFLLAVEIFYHYYIEKKNNENVFFLFLAALVLGIGTASKMTNAYVVIFSLLFLVSFYYRQMVTYLTKIGVTKSIGIVSLGLLLGVSLFLIRNYSFTGNPFFPIAKFGFKNIYLSAYADRPQLYSEPEAWAGALVKIKAHLWAFPQLILLLVAAFFLRLRGLSLFYVAMVVYMSKQTGPMYRFRMTNVFLILDLILFILVTKVLIQLPWFKKNIWLPRIFVVLVVGFSTIQVEKLFKYPMRYYSEPVGKLIANVHENWEMLLQNNLENRSNPQYVLATKTEVFPYFSRFPIISLYDSVPEHRYEYYKNAK